MHKERILIFNVNWVGDVLFSTAVIRNVRRNFPHAYIACVIPSRCYPVLKDNPHLDEVIVFDEKDRHRGVLDKLKFIRVLRSKKFDTVYLLHRSFSRALICRMAGIKNRVGYRAKKRSFLLTKAIKAPDPSSLHRIDYYMNVIEQAGLRVEDRFTEFYFSAAEEKYAADFLEKEGVKEEELLIGINPGGNWGPKRWPLDYWQELAEALSSGIGSRVVITGAQADMHSALRIKDAMRAKPVIACGALNLKQFAALCRRLDLFISGDTGPMHIANSVGTRVIALFGPTHISITGPYPDKNVTVLQKDVGCRVPCYEVKCRDNRCMKAITPQDVLKEVKRLIKEK